MIYLYYILIIMTIWDMAKRRKYNNEIIIQTRRWRWRWIGKQFLYTETLDE